MKYLDGKTGFFSWIAWQSFWKLGLDSERLSEWMRYLNTLSTILLLSLASLFVFLYVRFRRLPNSVTCLWETCNIKSCKKKNSTKERRMHVQKRKCSDWHMTSYNGLAIHHNSRYALQPISSAQAYVSGNSSRISKMSSTLVWSSGFKKIVGFLLHYL